MFKISLLITILTIVGCSSDPKKTNTYESAKTTKKKVVNQMKEVKQELSSQKPLEDLKNKANQKIKLKAPAVVETLESIRCTYNGDVRKITTVKLENSGCEVRYEKFEQKKVIASARYDIGHCSQMANKVSNNLEEAGFTCK